ncbi:MAG TPA: SWIM zinc finger family protein [Acidimicrobiia bacterium]|nr:SWIM zinc finger family protein [Acidimicrobiia bacterium]
MAESGTRWAVDDVLKLAPDAASAGAARRLSLSPVWSQAGSSGSLLWGRCQGSAREPYQVTIDLDEPSFRCTCPSRKHPCKHGLGLLLLWAEGGGSVADDARPADFAADWVRRLAARGAGGAGGDGRDAAGAAGGDSVGGGAAGGGAAAPDAEAQARRLAQRIETMSAGIDEFERWLFDLVRQGLASARHQPYAFWDAAAARLVDAQMPGLADRVRALPGLLHSAGDWAERLLAELARGYLAVSAWRRRDLLPQDVLADLRVVLGWPRRVGDVLEAGERVTDRWAVVGLAREDDTRLQSQRTWLVGERSGRVAMVLDFAAAGASLAVAEVLGSVVDAEVALYPGSEPRRALFTGDRAVVGSTGALPGLAGSPGSAGSVAAALDRVAGWLAANPFADRFPMALTGVVPVVDGARRMVVEPGGPALPLSADGDALTLLAISGGRPVDLFGEWDGFALTPLSVMADGALVGL